MSGRPSTHVLLASDGSRESLGAARFVRTLVDESRIDRISVLSVGHPFSGNNFWPMAFLGAGMGAAEALSSMQSVAEASAKQTLDKVLYGLGRLPIDVEPLIRVGRAADEILLAARDVHADFVVLGSHCRGPLGVIVHGSVSSEVIRRAQCPVVVVPPNYGRDIRSGGRRIPSITFPLAAASSEAALALAGV